MKELLTMRELTLTAANARALTERSLRSTLLAPLLAHVHGRIQKQAEKGHYSINDPHADFPGGWPDSHVLEALWSALREQGYRVYDHPDPDPGHPCSKPYIEVQW